MRFGTEAEISPARGLASERHVAHPVSRNRIHLYSVAVKMLYEASETVLRFGYSVVSSLVLRFSAASLEIRG